MSEELLFEKIWDAHEVGATSSSTSTCTWSTRVTSPQAFDGLRLAGRKVRRPDHTLATRPTTTCPPTARRPRPIADAARRAAGRGAGGATARSSASRSTSLGPERQGIVHVIGPELGVTQPGMTIVCGDSHTATHGAFGALAFGIGTSEVEHVLATQCLVQHKPKHDADQLRRRARPRRHRQGPDPGDDRPDRHRRRAPGTWSSTPARRSRRSRWRAG